MAAMLNVVGSTPVIQLTKIVPEGHARVFVKLEMFNPTGSYKDRAALAMIKGAERRGELKKGMTVVEATAGSTGAALAFVCTCKGYAFRAVTSNAYAEEKLRIMEAYGASLEVVHSPSGKITQDLVPKMIGACKSLAKREDVFYADQFNNRDAVEGYAGMAKEIQKDFPEGVDVICAAVGTAGLVTGLATALRQDGGTCPRIIVLEPSSSAVLSHGPEHARGHRIEGIATGSRPPLLNDDLYDEVQIVDDNLAKAMAQRLAKEEGILAGASTGLNVAAALAIASKLPPTATVLTMACDTGMKYMAGDLFKQDD